ncbi:hypothetical protein CANARDRAFT_9260 [[Candida] arabinofermentans NRRL YB-2248]|uniref:Uncharacterized protein n=1 Tax=[Candida] arabinofermentans NRRL YB-2248 TaxID=983967 RepID=A0A1E4SW26_9ASCO|nr:hypothetical protein CANARDRAFT_9260 [[Candida] arabinofermentans NRRL YB-2248]
MKFLIYLLLWGSVQSAIIPLKISELYSKTKTQKVLKLHSETSSYVDYHNLLLNNQVQGSGFEIYAKDIKSYETKFDVKRTSGILIAKEYFTKENLHRLGLRKTIESSKSLEVTGLKNGFLGLKKLLIPLKTRAVALLNSEKPVEITGSFPLGVIKNLQLLDYSLLIPISYLTENGDIHRLLKSSSLQHAIKSKDLLFYNNEDKIQFEDPMIIALFGEDKVFKSKGGAVELFTNPWYEAFCSFEWVNSAFCFINKVESSSCVKIRNMKLHTDIVPAFANGHLNYNGISRGKTSKGTEKNKRELDVTSLEPQFSKFSIFQNSTLDYNYAQHKADNAFKAFKIQVSDPKLHPNTNKYRNVTLYDQNEQDQTIKPTGKYIIDHKHLNPYPKEPRSPHYAQLIFPSYMYSTKPSMV